MRLLVLIVTKMKMVMKNGSHKTDFDVDIDKNIQNVVVSVR